MTSKKSGKSKPPEETGTMRSVVSDGAATGAADSSGESPQKRQKRKKKARRKEIEISLWINSVKYEFGIICTFCVKEPACVHCKECADFYCPECDKKAHATKKRKDHIRAVISKLDLDAAARKVTHAVRYHGHLLSLQARCRKKYRRYLDRKTMCYYYYNTVYGTTSWRKPYCLRKMDFKPFMSDFTAACKIAGMYRMWQARQLTIGLMNVFQRKIFDRQRMRFYYTFHRKSKLRPPQQWRRPYYYGKRGYPPDMKPVYTEDVAALTIQRKWRSFLMWQFLRAMIRAAHVKKWDPITGTFQYFNRRTDYPRHEKPKLLGSEPWDPNFVPDWNKARVSLFLRRIGLKQYVSMFEDYGVDGTNLLLLDEEDYHNLEVFSGVHQKKIIVELERIFPKKLRTDIKSEAHAARRERIRRVKLRDEAAIELQRVYRGHLGRVKVANINFKNKLAVNALQLQASVDRSAECWWTERNIPSKHIEPLAIENLPSPSLRGLPKSPLLRLPPPGTPGKDVVAGGDSNIMGSSAAAAKRSEKLLKLLSKHEEHKKKGYETFEINLPGIATKPEANIAESVLKLPPLKTFGRKQDHLTAKGWGRYDSHGNWIPLSQSSSASGTSTTGTGSTGTPSKGDFLGGDANPTKLLTLRLRHNGYDQMRDQIALKAKLF